MAFRGEGGSSAPPCTPRHEGPAFAGALFSGVGPFFAGFAHPLFARLWRRLRLQVSGFCAFHLRLPDCLCLRYALGFFLRRSVEGEARELLNGVSLARLQRTRCAWSASFLRPCKERGIIVIPRLVFLTDLKRRQVQVYRPWTRLIPAEAALDLPHVLRASYAAANLSASVSVTMFLRHAL